MNNGNHSPNYGTKMEEGEKSPVERGVYRGVKLWGRGMWGSALLVGCLGLAVPWLGCSDGQKPRQWPLELAEDSATLEQGPGGPRSTRQPWSLTCPPIMCGTQSCTLCPGPALHTSSWSRDCPNPVSCSPQASWPQQPPRAKLGWGCLVLEEQVGREGTGTLPELLLYK